MGEEEIANALVEDWGCDGATAREAAGIMWMTGLTPGDDPEDVEELLALLA